MSPSEIVTGSIRIRIFRRFESRKSTRLKLKIAANARRRPYGVFRRSHTGIASWITVPDEDADRVRVDLVLLRESWREPHEDRDDRHVPEEGRDCVGAEAVVAN